MVLLLNLSICLNLSNLVVSAMATGVKPEQHVGLCHVRPLNLSNCMGGARWAL